MLSIWIVLLIGLSSSVSARDCDGTCGQGEGDCDRDSDCLPGLICNFDWWWGDDFCEAGPDTKNFEWASWGNWSDCIGNCSSLGEQSRHRECTPPSNGGYDCPAPFDSEVEQCEMEPCPIDCVWDEWSIGQCSETCGEGVRNNSRVKLVEEAFGGFCNGSDIMIEACHEGECPPLSNPKCNPKTWSSYDKECCSVNEPCGYGEGDCDVDDECAGELVCGKNNCLRLGTTFKKGSDCCELPRFEGFGNLNCEPANLPTWLSSDEEKNDLLKECCSEERPCGFGQGDCDNDSECEGSLTCGNDNCGTSFFDPRTDCCE